MSKDGCKLVPVLPTSPKSLGLILPFVKCLDILFFLSRPSHVEFQVGSILYACLIGAFLNTLVQFETHFPKKNTSVWLVQLETKASHPIHVRFDLLRSGPTQSGWARFARPGFASPGWTRLWIGWATLTKNLLFMYKNDLGVPWSLLGRRDVENGTGSKFHTGYTPGKVWKYSNRCVYVKNKQLFLSADTDTVLNNQEN